MTDEELHEKIFLIIYEARGTCVDQAWRVVNLVKEELHNG